MKQKRENIFKSENMERNCVKWGFFGGWGGGVGMVGEGGGVVERTYSHIRSG